MKKIIKRIIVSLIAGLIYGSGYFLLGIKNGILFSFFLLVMFFLGVCSNFLDYEGDKQ